MKTPYAQAFEILWSVYPPRQPGDSKKLAYKAWQARLREGIPEAMLLEAVRSYHRWCEQTRKAGTEFVMMAATFLGPNERWQAFAPKPSSSGAADSASGCRPSPDAEERVDAREWIADLLRGLSERRRSPTCTHQRGKP